MPTMTELIERRRNAVLRFALDPGRATARPLRHLSRRIALREQRHAAAPQPSLGPAPQEFQTEGYEGTGIIVHDTPLGHEGLGAASSNADARRGVAKSKAGVDVAQSRQRSQWTPVIVGGAVVAVGVIALAIMSRKRK